MATAPRIVFATLLLLLGRPGSALAQTHVIGWGAQVFDSGLHEEPMLEVAAGGELTLAIRGDGTLAAWGDNTYGQCEPPALPAGVRWLEVAAGNRLAIGKRSDGALVAWGTGPGVPAPPPGLTYRAFAAGHEFVIAIRSDGTLAHWGYGGGGLSSSIPLAPPGQVYLAVAAGSAHALALRSDGHVDGWGNSAWGQSNVPALPPGQTYLEIAAGAYSSLALRSDGQVIAWGYNADGQCDVPAPPPGVSYVSIAAGGLHAVALRSDGRLAAWGRNLEQQCDVPAVPTGSSFVELAAGAWHTAARLSDGRVVCWGANRKCQCNAPRLPPGVEYTTCAASSRGCEVPDSHLGHFAALRDDGTIATWGDAPSGSVPPLPAGVRYTDLGLGMQHSAALRSDGSIVAWGSNLDGACNVPPPPPGLDYVEVDAGGLMQLESCSISQGWWYRELTVARRSDGSIVEWGACDLDQCSEPVGAFHTQLASSGTRLAALRADGSIVSWGLNPLVLPPPPAGSSYVEVALGGGAYYETHCMQFDYIPPLQIYARRSDGSIAGWYLGWSLGPAIVDVPQLPPGLSYVEVAAGDLHALARRSDGSVVAWGSNGKGQCKVPLLPAGHVFRRIDAGPFSSVALYAPAPACGSVSRYCSAGANSVWPQGAELDARGCPGLSANDLALHVTNLPAATVARLVYGSAQQYTPFGNGRSCVAGSVQRLPPVATSTGALDCPLDLAQYPFSGSANAILPGSAWNFQLWYRDPLGAPSTVNLTDALHIVFAP